jgi:hypothetical protein
VSDRNAFREGKPDRSEARKLSALGGMMVMSEAARCGNTERPLARPIDLTDRQDSMNATCSVEGCARLAFRHEICQSHYDRLRRTGELGAAEFRTPRTQTTCKVPECGKSNRNGAHGWCPAHYERVRQHGSPGTKPIKVHGAPKPICAVDACDRYAPVRGYCQKHAARIQKHGDPHIVGDRLLPPPPEKGPENPNWVGDAASYSAVHRRLWSERGKVGQYECRHCGKAAKNWAYDYTDPSPKFNEHGSPYSTDLGRYFPLCVSCHRKFDNGMRA